MEPAQLDSKEWRRIVSRLGGEARLELTAREHRALVRVREIKSAADLLRLALAYGPGGYSLRPLAALAAAQGVADISDVALLKRLRKCADWLQALCAAQLEQVATIIGAGAERPIRIVDGSRLEGPGDRVWRLHLCYDAGLGRMADFAVTTMAEGERLDRLAVTSGEIRLGDRGFGQPDGIKNTLEAGGDVLVRLTWNSLQLTLANGKSINWMKLFKKAKSRGTLDLDVRVRKARGRFEPIAMRLVIIKKPPAAAAKARAKAQRASRKDQHRTDRRTIAAADYVILLTSLTREEFSVDALGALYRLRWQIEIAIKRLKSILHVDRLPAKDPDLARAWLYAHLLLALQIDAAMAEPGAIPPCADRGPPAVDLAHHHSHRHRPARRHLAAA